MTETRPGHPSMIRPFLAILFFLLGAWPAFGASQEVAGSQEHAHRHHGGGGSEATAGPAEVGQDAFAALGEIRSMLVSEPETDWSAVDLDALREHLVDMYEVTLRAAVSSRPVDGGFEARVTGEGRTADAIRRLVLAHAAMMDGRNGLLVTVRELSGDEDELGVVVSVTTSDADAVDRLRGLGFYGFLVGGGHHRPHHLAIAKGARPHGG